MKDKDIIRYLQEDRLSKAIEGLYGIYPSIESLVKKNQGNREDSEDIFQEALIVLFKKVKKGDFVLSSSLKTFIYGISKNLWLQELRRRGKLVYDNDSDFKVEEIENDERQILAQSAFKLLGDKCKEILIMFYYADKSMQEIASKLGFSNEKVAKNQKYRCLEKAKTNYQSLIIK